MTALTPKRHKSLKYNILRRDTQTHIKKRNRKVNGNALPFVDFTSKITFQEFNNDPVEMDVWVKDEKQSMIQDEEQMIKIEDRDHYAKRIESLQYLVGGIAHDFNNLLQAIQGQAELLLLTRKNDAELNSRLQRVMKTLQRAAEVTQHLLSFSGFIDAKFSPTDLNLEVPKIARLIRPMLPESIEVKLNLINDPAIVNADPSHLRAILVNLAMNAKDAMPDGGQILIRTKIMILGGEPHHDPKVPAGRYVLLSVSDIGHGMDKKIKQHIFDPYYTTRSCIGKRGLGLSVVYGLVKNHGGHIAYSSQVNQGTTFEISLPLL